MSKPRLFPSLVLIAIFLAACAPATGTASPGQPVVGADTASPSLAPKLDSSAQATPGSTDTPAPLPSPAATSRGPELHATDPATVSLASGGLQLVEFFRFTWGTCRSMAPMVHGLEAKYFGRVQFTYLDADDPQTRDFQRTLGFNYQPEIYLLDGNGNVLQKWVGYTSEGDLEAAFAEHLQ